MRKITPRRIVLGFQQIIFTFTQTARLVWSINPRLLLTAFIVNTVSGILIFPTIYLEKLTIDALVQNLGNPFWQEALGGLSFLFLLRVTVGVLLSGMTRLSNYFQHAIGRVFQAHMDLLLSQKMSQLDMATIENPHFKDRYNKVERESSHRAWGLAIPLAQIPNYFFGLVSTFSLIFFFNPLIAILIFIFSIPEFLIDAKYTRLEYEFESAASHQYRLWGWMVWYLTKAKTLLEAKILNLSSYFLKRTREIQDKLVGGNLKIRKQREMAHFFAYLPQNILIFFLSIYLGFLAIFQKLTVGSAEMYLRAIYSFQGNLTALVGSLLELYENYLFVTDLVWFLNLPPQISSGRRKFPAKIKKGIEFKDVWFRYKENQKWVLRGINLFIPQGETVAIVGENGAGKTSLVKLLCRFYEPQKGKILIDDIDIREYRRREIWDNLSVLFQNFEGFPFTARESIGYGKISEVTNLDLIINSAKKSIIHDYLYSLPLKYENPLSADFENGVEPSFGQWQRIGLARVLMRGAQVTILDEPTSNVDPKSEEQIFAQLSRLVKGKILILISHRFSTVRRAKTIVVMDKGRIIEYGSHRHLLARRGYYAKLFELQAKGYR